MMHQNIIIFNSEHGTMAIRRADDAQFVLHVCRMSGTVFFVVVIDSSFLLSLFAAESFNGLLIYSL